jgi:phosphohistidine phosphatase SixA
VRGGIPKVVHYWSAKPPADANVGAYRANHEIDDVRWFRLGKARELLDYEHDVDLLDTFAASAFDSSPLIVVRHSQARSRKSWSRDDGERPLNAAGKVQAERLVPLLRAYGIRHVVTSDAARCVDTVLPYVNSGGVRLRLDPAMSEEGKHDAQVRRLMKRLVSSKKRVAVCSHRPVLPVMIKALGLDPIQLAPSGLVVVHRKDGKVVDTELYP